MVQHLEDDLGEWGDEHRELIVPVGQIGVFDEFGFAICFVVVDVQLHVRVRLEDAVVAQRSLINCKKIYIYIYLYSDIIGDLWLTGKVSNLPVIVN